MRYRCVTIRILWLIESVILLVICFISEVMYLFTSNIIWIPKYFFRVLINRIVICKKNIQMNRVDGICAKKHTENYASELDANRQQFISKESHIWLMLMQIFFL